MNSLKNIANNIFSHWVLVAVNLVISFFMAPFIVNTLGNLYFGLWVTLMQFTGYLYLMDFGLRNTVVHRTAQAIGGKRKSTLLHLISASTILSSILASLTIIVVLIGSQLIPYILDLEPEVITEAKWVLIIGGATIALTIWNNPYEGVVRGFGLFLIANIYGFFSLIIRTILTVTLLLMGHKIIALALVQFFVSVIYAIFIYILAKKHLRKNGFIKKKAKLTQNRFFALVKSVWRYSWAILVDNLSQKLIFSSDTIIISTMLSVPLVTFYAIANQLIEYLRRLIDSGMAVLMPVASEITGSQDNSDLKGVLIHSTRFMGWFALPVLTMFLVMGETFIGLWMGADYSKQAGEILLILTITQMFALQHYGITVVIRSLEKHKIIAQFRMVEAIINIILSIILAKKMGLVGVALGTAISHTFVTSIVLPYVVIKELKIKYRDFIIPAYFRNIITCSLIGILGYTINTYFKPESLATFFAYSFSIAFIYLILSFLITLNRHERRIVVKKLQLKAKPA